MTEKFMSRDERKMVKITKFGNKDLGQLNVVDLDALADKFMADRKAAGGGTTINIRCTRVKKNVNTSLKFPHVKDPYFNYYYGFPMSVYRDGNVAWRRLVLGEQNSFNLEDPNDVKLFLVVRMHPEVMGSPFGNDDGDSKWYVDDPMEAAMKAVKEADEFDKAYKCIAELRTFGHQRMITFGRTLGINEDDLSNESIAFGLLLKEARERPTIVLFKYNSKDRNSEEVALAGIAGGLISSDPVTNSYKFKGVNFGPGTNDVVFALQRDESLMIQVIAELQIAGKWPNANDNIKNTGKKTVKPVEEDM
jgi:hypothetical protein